MTTGPNIVGFKDAQHRLREALGSDVLFRIPVAPVWDPSVPRDRETGMPYDPTAVPISGGDFTEVTLRVATNFKPIRVHIVDDVTTFAGGVERTDQTAVVVDAIDWPAVRFATEFVWNGVDWKITQVIPDGIAGTERYIVFGQVK